MNAPATIPLETKSRKADPELERAVYRAVEDADLTGLQGWDSVVGLAPEVYPESMVVYVEGMLGDADEMTIPADLTLLLVYESDETDLPTEFQDNYPAQIKLRRDKDSGDLKLVDIKIVT
jgi:hypothetical protein